MIKMLEITSFLGMQIPLIMVLRMSGDAEDPSTSVLEEELSYGKIR